MYTHSVVINVDTIARCYILFVTGPDARADQMACRPLGPDIVTSSHALTSSLAAVSTSNVSTKRNRRKGTSERPCARSRKSKTGKSNLYLVIDSEAARTRWSLFVLVFVS